MNSVVYVILNFLFGIYMLWCSVKFKFYKVQKGRLAVNGLFLFAAFACFLNAVCIMLSYFNLTVLSSIFGNIMFFLCGLFSVYLFTTFVIDFNFQNVIVRSLVSLFLIGLCVFTVFLRFNSLQFFEDCGYKIQTSSFLGTKFTYLDFYYFVFLLLLPFATLVNLLFHTIKEKNFIKRQLYGFIFSAIFAGMVYTIGTLAFSYFSKEFNMYNTLFTFGFVVFGMLIEQKPDENLQITPILLSFSIFDFFIVIVIEGILSSLVFILMLPFKYSNPVLYCSTCWASSFVCLVISCYVSYIIHAKYYEKEEFKKRGYKISEENKILQYIQYYTETIESDRFNVDYNMGSEYQPSDDILDFIKINKNRYILIFGNIKNNSPEVRRSMLILKSMHRTFFQNSSDLKEFVSKINDYIMQNLQSPASVYLFVGVLELSEDSLYYINCGMKHVNFYNAQMCFPSEMKDEEVLLGLEANIGEKLLIKKLKMNPIDKVFITNDETDDLVDISGKCMATKKSVLEIKCNLVK
ncbi:MAG: SpoIIE family protein phosphatase [Treponemataceae bacterium]|nr:SpoIIE family protein phosphatase [Treponemataceae bacterium]